MSLLFRIVYAAHANGTHHKLALDALRALDGPDGEAWRRLFLKNAETYMTGAKAPDDTFKDFKNHVLHVRDNFWGGAADQVEGWYDKLVDLLRGESWAEAVYAAGVLSHYFTDPLHPFHTGQTEAENNIHRAAEWSVSRSYNALRAQGEAEFANVAVTPASGPHWLRELVIAGAEESNRNYEKLIAHYDIGKGVVDPPAGLDAVSRRVVAEILMRAASGLSVVFSRAFAEAKVAPPQVALTLETVLAAVKIPAKMLAKRLSDAEDRRVVEAMYDELKATGTVEHALPEDDKIVREAHREDVLRHQLAGRQQQRAAVIAKRPVPAAAPTPAAQIAPIAPKASTPPAPRTPPPAAAESLSALSSRPQSAPATSVPSVPFVMTQQVSASAPTAAITPVATLDPDAAAPRLYLTPGDDVERAPSIGPKTAERLYAVGIRTVADLLAADPGALEELLDVSHIKARTLRDWQDQARMVSEIAGLRGTHAQLLVGAGYRTRDAVAKADTTKLCADVLAYAATPDGQRLLRDGAPPDVERIKSWLASAAASKAA